MCSGQECEDIYHLACAGLTELPTGDWFCPNPPGCKGRPRGVRLEAVAPVAPAAEEGDDGKKRKRSPGKRVTKKKRVGGAEGSDDEAPEEAVATAAAPLAVATAAATTDEEGEEDGRTWKLVEPLHIGGKEYPRVTCESLDGRVYYAMNPFAYEVLGMPGHAASSHIQHNVGWPDRLNVTSKFNPRDCERLRRIGFLGSRQSMSGPAVGIGSGRVRVLITADAIRVVVATVPGLKDDPKVMAGVKLMEDALKDDKPTPLPDPPAPSAEELAAAAKADAEDDRAAAAVAAMAGGIPLDPDDPAAQLFAQAKEIQAAVGQFRSVLGDLRRDIDALKVKVSPQPPAESSPAPAAEPVAEPAPKP